jgi:hypothetical protein
LNHDGLRLSLSKLAEERVENVPDAAASYVRMGLRVTPLRGKDAFLPGWQNQQLSEEELPHLFTSGRNVGILLGGDLGLVDVDLDNTLAVGVARCILPATLMSGREKNPHSHYWYICQPPPPSRTYALPKDMAARLELESHGATLVELRGMGRQTMVAPSVHPEDGDRYLWHGGAIREIDGEELAGLVADVAVATLLALNWPPKGSRQEFVLAAAGYLGRHLEHERVATIMEAAALAAGDEEKDDKRSRAVQDTLAKLEGG